MHGAEERRGERAIDALGEVIRTEERREGVPAGGADQGVELARRHGRLVGDTREGVRLHEVATVLALPQDGLLGHAVRVGVLDLHQVVALDAVLTAEVLHRDDEAPPVADGGEHADAGMERAGHADADRGDGDHRVAGFFAACQP